MDQVDAWSSRRVAVLLSGNVRDIERTADRVMSSVVDALDADVFIHTWDTIEHRDPTWWRRAGDADTSAVRTDPDLIERLCRPVSMIVEPMRIFSSRSVGACESGLQIPVTAIMSLWFGVSEAFRLMQDHEITRGSQYDHVVRWRFDLVPSRPLGPTDLDGRLRLVPWSGSRALSLSSDVAAVGPRDLMERYASIFATTPSSIDAFVAESGYLGFSHEAFLEACLGHAGLDREELEIGTRLIRLDASEVVISSTDAHLHPDDVEPDHLLRFFPPSERRRMAAILRSRLELAGCPHAEAVAMALLGSMSPMGRGQAVESFHVLRAFLDWLGRSGSNGRWVATAVLDRWWRRYRRSTSPRIRFLVLGSPAFWRLWSIGALSRLRLRARTSAGRMTRALRTARPSGRVGRIERGAPDTISATLPSREFNEVIVDRRAGIVRKTSAHPQTLLDEIGYLDALPSDLRELFAPVRGFSVDPEDPYLELGFVAGRPLDQLFLDDSVGAQRWLAIWESVAGSIDRFAADRREVSIGSLLEMYIDKTTERLAGCEQFPDLQRLLECRTLRINGVEHRDLRSLVRRAQERVIATADGAHGSVIHGDLCLSNILRTGDSVTLIDPRGRFGDVGIGGDLRYDIAKLHHSVVGGYDHMVAGRFSFDIGPTGVDFEVQFSGRQQEIADLYRDRILRDWSVEEIELISGLILAGLAPLHRDAPARQIAFLLRATQMLSSVLDGRPGS